MCVCMYMNGCPAVRDLVAAETSKQANKQTSKE
jgi:uncharacterized protein YceK